MTLRPWLFSTFNFRRLFAVRRTLGDQCKLFHARPACALVIRDEWNTQRIRNLGVLYAIPDFVSLFLVSRMAFSTKLHHVCVVVFMVANLFNDYSDDGVGRALVVYAPRPAANSPVLEYLRCI
uniref:Uncharacterized protein n=1 Tax=Chrysotila carterae TaxID=13221 RepID=A0A6S9XHW2_CHRCT